MTKTPTDTSRMTLLVSPSEIAYVCAILDGYPGLCLATQANRNDGTITLEVAPGQKELLLEILSDLRLEVGSWTLSREESGGK